MYLISTQILLLIFIIFAYLFNLLPKASITNLYGSRVNSLRYKYIEVGGSGLKFTPANQITSTPINNFQELFQKFNCSTDNLLFTRLYFFRIFRIFIETRNLKISLKTKPNPYLFDTLNTYYKLFSKYNNNLLNIYTRLDQNFLSKYSYQAIRQVKVNFVGGVQLKKQFNGLLINKYEYLSPLLRGVSNSSAKKGIFYYNQTSNNILTYISNKFQFKSYGGVEYTNTNTSKYLKSSDLNSFDILFLRKSKIFNKGRYSRNRQFYRTGVYWCLYLSIILFSGLYYWFYHFTINFGFFWWLFFALVSSFILPKSMKYRFYNFNKLYSSLSLSIFWVTAQVKLVLSTLYQKSWVSLHSFVLIDYIYEGLSPNLSTKNSSRYSRWIDLSDGDRLKRYSSVNYLYNLSEKLFSGGAEPQTSTKSPVEIPYRLFSKIITLLFGLFRSSTFKLNTKVSSPLAKDLTYFFCADLYKYDQIFSYLTSFSNLLYTSSLPNLSTQPNRLYQILRLLLILLSTILFIIFLSYFLVLVFYRLDLVLPNVLNFNLIGTTIMLFSLTNSNLIGSKSFTDLISVITKVNYNNVEESGGYTDLQKKYFLKHESTYFLDKKCAESWINEYYLPSEYFFNSRFIDNQTTSKDYIDLLQLVPNLRNKVLDNYEAQLSNTLWLSSGALRNIPKTFFLNTITFSGQSLVKEVIVLDLILKDGPTSTPLSKFKQLNLILDSKYRWEEIIPSKEGFQKELSSLHNQLDDNEVYFWKNLINLNKFFIENRMYAFGGIDWLYFYFLPTTLQEYLLNYSDFVKWVVYNSSFHNFYENNKQVNNLLDIVNLTEISTPKLDKKL